MSDLSDPPVVIRVTVWLDREPDVDTAGLPPYLAAAALWRVLQLLDPELMVYPDEESAE